MEGPRGGLILDGLARKDFVHERVFGSAPRYDRTPLGRDVSAVPVPLQGDLNTCVPCSVTFVVEWLKQEHPGLSHEWLADISQVRPEGATFRQVLEPARKNGIVTRKTWTAQAEFETMLEEAAKNRLPGYFRIMDLSADGLYHALRKGLVIVGVRDYRGIGPHAMVAYDVTPDGLALRCRNWHAGDTDTTVRFDDVVVAYVPNLLPDDKTKHDARLYMMDFLKHKVLGAKKGLLALLGAILGLTGAVYGAGYTPVTGYQSRTTSFLTAAATTISVSGTKDRSGTQIALTSIGTGSVPRVYLTLEPGGANEEIVACTGITATSFTGCSRGLPFQGGSLTPDPALAKTHNAGSRVIMSNVGQFYAEYVSKSGDETVEGVKTFVSFPAVTSSGAHPAAAAQFATKGYADSLVAAGVAPSSTQGLAFDSDSTLYVMASSTDSADGGFLKFGTAVNNLGLLFWDVTAFLAKAWTWVGTQTFTDAIFTGNVSLDGNATSTGTLRVQTPTDPYDATTKEYTDSVAAAAAVASFYGDGSDGDFTVTTTTTLTKDTYYGNLTVADGATLDAGGYRLFVNGTLTRQGTGIIKNDGGNGGNGGNGSSAGSGTGGTAGSAGGASKGLTTPSGQPGKVGKAGAGSAGNVSNSGAGGTAGDAGISAVAYRSGNGGAGGTGGNAGTTGGGSQTGGAGGAAGTGTFYGNPAKSVLAFGFIYATGTSAPGVMYPSPGSGGGATGAWSVGPTALQFGTGGSGGSGGSGGYLVVAANKIVDSGTGTMFSAKGGNGGNGGTNYCSNETAACAFGGAGGGAAGNGGVIFLFYVSKTGSATTDVSAGTVGTGAANLQCSGGGTSSAGSNGGAGSAGAVYSISFSP